MWYDRAQNNDLHVLPQWCIRPHVSRGSYTSGDQIMQSGAITCGCFRIAEWCDRLNYLPDLSTARSWRGAPKLDNAVLRQSKEIERFFKIAQFFENLRNADGLV